jgi:hypothetical protein
VREITKIRELKEQKQNLEIRNGALANKNNLLGNKNNTLTNNLSSLKRKLTKNEEANTHVRKKRRLSETGKVQFHDRVFFSQRIYCCF